MKDSSSNPEILTIKNVPVYEASMDEMKDLSIIILRTAKHCHQYGGVVVRPPPSWKKPPLKISNRSRFFTRHQNLPEAPFAEKVTTTSRAPATVELANAPREHGSPVGRTSDKQADEAAAGRRSATQKNLPWFVSNGAMPHPQDRKGRLKVPVSFPDSTQPVSLSDFKKGAAEFEQFIREKISDLRKHLCVAQIEETFEEARSRIEALEAAFWDMAANGVDGQPVMVRYGVDVEAAGAWDRRNGVYATWEPHARESISREEREGDFRERSLDDGVLVEEEVLDEGNANDEEERELDKGKYEKHCSGEAESHVGNVNKNGLLRHHYSTPGVNESMFYIGSLFTRFCWHVEDAYLISIAFVHLGGAEKVWYTVPPEYAARVDSYASEHVFAPGMQDEKGKGELCLLNKTTLFNPTRLLEQGIEVYRAVQIPGTFVVTAPRAYHAGFNCGFNVSEAVNFANASWLKTGEAAAAFSRLIRRPMIIPLEYLVIREAVALRDRFLHDFDMRSDSVSELHKEEAELVAEQLDKFFVEGEKLVKSYATRQHVHVEEICEVEEALRVGRDIQVGGRRGIRCVVCNNTCHMFVEICAGCRKHELGRCMYHFGSTDAALCRQQACPVKGERSTVIRRYNALWVIDLIEAVEKMAGVVVGARKGRNRFDVFVRTYKEPELFDAGLPLTRRTGTMTPTLILSDIDDERVTPNQRVAKKRRASSMTRQLECAMESKVVEVVDVDAVEDGAAASSPGTKLAGAVAHGKSVLSDQLRNREERKTEGRLGEDAAAVSPCTVDGKDAPENGVSARSLRLLNREMRREETRLAEDGGSATPGKKRLRKRRATDVQDCGGSGVYHPQ